MLFIHKQQLHFRSRSLWIQTLFVCFFWIPSSKMNSAPLLLIPRWTGNKVQASCELVDPLRPPESQNICKPQFVDDRNKVFIPFYYSCCFVIYSAWVYISLDHPAGSIEAFQNPDSRARRLIPMLHHSTKNCNNNKMKLVNDFHIHTEVSSVETGNHLHFARPCSSLEERGWHYRVMFGIFPPSAVLWMDGRTRWVSPPSCPVFLGNIDHSSWRMLEMKERMVIFRLYACLWVWVE